MAEVTERDRKLAADLLGFRANVDMRAAGAHLVAEFREAAVAEEREACAMLHESVPNECDRDLHKLSVTGCGCGAMGAVIAYRDAIRKRGER